MNHLHSPRLALFSALALATGLAFAQNPGAITMPGAELAKPALLKGPLHTVAEPVKVDEHFGRFVIESKFGKFSVIGEKMLEVRVSELQAIEELQKVQQDSAFTDALTKTAKGVGKFAESVVTEPAKTVENIGKGIGTVFGRVGYLAHSGSNYVSDQASDLVGAGPKDQPKAKPVRAEEPEPPSFIGDPLGYNMARREWAKKLQIDPYTSNPVLRPLLDKAATATFAGNFGVTLTLGVVLIPVQYAYQLDDTVRQSVWNIPAIDLEKANEAKLIALGVPERTVRDLFRNKWFTPTLQTALVVRLEEFGKIPGVTSVVATAAVTKGEARARFLLESLAMLATYHKKEARFSKIKMSNLVPAGVGKDGAIVAAVAIDYGTWSKDAASFAQRQELAGKKKTLLVAGKVSPEARQAIEKAGWSVKQGLRV